MARLVAALAVLVAWGCTPTAPPPLGEAVVVVDTDLPPSLANHLRIDFYDQSGTWYLSRDLPRGKPGDWPTSFGVALRDGQAPARTLVRLRLYPDGHTRDYRGERYQERPTGGNPLDPALVGPPSDLPRLLDAAGNDVTPATEPAPLVTVDRVVAIRLIPGVVGAARIVLRGACSGTMADLQDPSNPMTCEGTEAERVAVSDVPLDPDTSVSPSLIAGTFGADVALPCTAPGRMGPSPLHDDDVCVTGGAFVFGSQDGSIGDAIDDAPERTAVVPSFWMDRYEVTVARFRDRVANGFNTGFPQANEGPLGSSGVGEQSGPMCTWSATPRGREDYPVNCISPELARHFCEFEGGDLPLEVQWEYAATLGGRDQKTHYPWGDDPPSCSSAIFARGNFTGNDDGCGPRWGPASVTAAEHDGGDVSLGLGIVDLGGNVSEIGREPRASFASNCWAAARLVLPTCAAPSPTVIMRGAGWTTAPAYVISAQRAFMYLAGTTQGFRCVRPGAQP